VWSHYQWVLYSNPDVIVTPEFFVNMSARLTDDESRSGRLVDLYADRFPTASTRGRTTRYSMELLVFRTRSMIFRGSTASVLHSVFEKAAVDCLSSARGIFPEVAMRTIVLKHAMRVKLLEAVYYVRSSQAEVTDLLRQHVLARLAPQGWNVGVTKTALVPGGVWHNEDMALANEYLHGLETHPSCALNGG